MDAIHAVMITLVPLAAAMLALYTPYRSVAFAYVVLVFFAGCGYGVAYKLGGGIEAAVGTHFIVNLVHFLFFTYPMLANQYP